MTSSASSSSAAPAAPAAIVAPPPASPAPAAIPAAQAEKKSEALPLSAKSSGTEIQNEGDGEETEEIQNEEDGKESEEEGESKADIADEDEPPSKPSKEDLFAQKRTTRSQTSKSAGGSSIGLSVFDFAPKEGKEKEKQPEKEKEHTDKHKEKQEPAVGEGAAGGGGSEGDKLFCIECKKEVDGTICCDECNELICSAECEENHKRSEHKHSLPASKPSPVPPLGRSLAVLPQALTEQLAAANKQAERNTALKEGVKSLNGQHVLALQIEGQGISLKDALEVLSPDQWFHLLTTNVVRLWFMFMFLI